MLYIIVCGIVSLPADREHGPCSQGISRDPEKDWRAIMAYNILFTSLFSVGKDEPLRYYYAQEGDKRLIRNETNHAAENVEEADTLFPDEKDVSLKLIHIQESGVFCTQDIVI